MRHATVTHLITLVTLLVALPLLAQQETAVPKDHPLKTLSDAQLRAEVAIWDARKEQETSRAELREAAREAEAQVREVVEAMNRAMHRERRRPHEARDEARAEEIQLARREAEAARREDEVEIQAAAQRQERASQRIDQARDTFRRVRDLTERWKETGMDLELIVPLFLAIEAEVNAARELLGKDTDAIREIADHWLAWRQEIEPDGPPGE